jgi:hypothetical protein
VDLISRRNVCSSYPFSLRLCSIYTAEHSIAFRSGDRCPLPLLGLARKEPGPAPRAVTRTRETEYRAVMMLPVTEPTESRAAVSVRLTAGDRHGDRPGNSVT